MTTASTTSYTLPRATSRTSADVPEHVQRWWRWLHRPVITPPADGVGGRVLLISYQFPPTGGSGVQRPAKLAKYLPRCGWQVEVLTAAHDRFPWTDTSLLADLPDDLITHRIAGHEPACVARWLGAQCARLGGERYGRRVDDALHWRLTGWADRLGLQNGESLWIGPATRAAIRRHRETPFDAVISTGPPHFVHRVAMQVARLTGLPWLADLRDPLVSDFDRTGCSPRQARRMREYEADIVERADLIVTTCPSFAWDLQQRYPERTRRIRAITNGFDRDDIRRAVRPAELAGDTRDECTLVAAGAFYGRRELSRIIRPLQRLMQLHPPYAGRVKLVIAGTIDAEQRRALQQNTPEFVSLAGYVDHAEAIALTARAACSIVVVPACEHGHLSIPGKTFELLAVPTHVLALVPSGSDTEHIVRRTGGCTVAPFEREHAVFSALRGIIESHFSGELQADRDWTRVDAFDRQIIARRFADCLEAACCEKTGRRGIASHNREAVEVA
ncbi:MAG TPA: glycosyltransferase [Phycisphaerae bacterium]|nr:glycosyltransferase [Phycisphaerae bacterium]